MRSDRHPSLPPLAAFSDSARFGWGPPAPGDDHPRLFSHDARKCLAELSVSRDDLIRWRAAGWLTFDAANLVRLEDHHYFEIRFIRDVARSGLDDAQVNVILGTLPGSRSYPPGTIAWCFGDADGTAGWVTQRPPRFSDIETLLPSFFGEYVERLVALGRADLLNEMREVMDECWPADTEDDGPPP